MYTYSYIRSCSIIIRIRTCVKVKYHHIIIIRSPTSPKDEMSFCYSGHNYVHSTPKNVVTCIMLLVKRIHMKRLVASIEEQVKWVVMIKDGADYAIGEIFCYFAEAKIAVEVIKAHSKPAVITFCIHRKDESGQLTTLDGDNNGDACKQIAS